MPIQYIVKNWNFRYIKYRAFPPVFIPRFESQQLISILAPQLFTLGSLRFLDLGCGSGVLGISLVKEFGGTGVSVDINKKCLMASKYNLLLNKARQDSIRFVHSDMIEFLKTTNQKFNVIITNPPYIKIKDRENLAKQITQYQSQLALYGGEDGLYFVRQILKYYKRVLQPNGILAIQYGGEPLTNDLQQFQQYVANDYYNNRRFIIIHH